MISGHVKGIFLTVKLGAEIYTNDMRLHNKLRLSVFFQRRNETIIPAAQISKREKLLFFRPGPASSSSSCLQGTERVEVKQSALCHCSCSGRLRTGRVALVGYRTAVCRYDGLRSEARGPAAGGGSAADCGRHHHRAALHNGSQLGKEEFKV